MTTLWIDPLSDDGQELIDDRINQLIKTTYNPAVMIMEAVYEFTMADHDKTVEFVNENDMLGLGNFMYLKAYDYAYELATKQAEHEFNNGELE
jgi:arabinogalactan endo-1,4-beta-galactosidase